METQTKNQIVHITDQNFESFLADSNVPVLVDYWASW